MDEMLLFIKDDDLEPDGCGPFDSRFTQDLSIAPSALGFDGLDPMLWVDIPASMPNSEADLELVHAPMANLNSITNIGVSSQQAWREPSSWCNPEPAAEFASLEECMNEVDDTGGMLDTDDGTALGQADSSAAGSGKHGSSATHHEEGENSSPLGCIGAPSKAHLTACDAFTDSFLVRSLSAGNVPETARAHTVNSSALMCKMELEVDTGLLPSWMTAQISNHPLSNHCPGATNIELLEAPEDAATGLLVGSPACGRPLAMQGSVAGTESCRMADMSSINASWQVVPASMPEAALCQVPSSFMIPNESASCWPDSNSGLSEHHQENRSLGAWSTAATEALSNEGDGSDGRGDGGGHGASADAGARRSLRASRSMPNFRSLALGLGPQQQQRVVVKPAPIVPEEPSEAALATQPAQADVNGAGPRRVIIHRWPSGSSGPSLARKSRAAEELARSGAPSRKLSVSSGTKPRKAVPTPCLSTAGSLADLASPLTAAASTALTTSQQPAMAGAEADEPHRAVGSSGGETTEPAVGPARHPHNLRGRTAINHAALHEGTAGYGGYEGRGWVQQQPQQGGMGAGAAGISQAGFRTSRLPEVPPPQTHGGKKRAASGGPGSTCARPVPHPCGNCCSACGTTVTPVWRAGPQGPKTLCNACGVRYMKVAKRK